MNEQMRTNARQTSSVPALVVKWTGMKCHLCVETCALFTSGGENHGVNFGPSVLGHPCVDMDRLMYKSRAQRGGDS